MTRGEILNMPAGHEMDALVATMVMGWKLHPHKTHWIIGNTPTAYNHYRQFGDFLPSVDIASAWEVVEKMREMDEYICPQIYWDDDDGLGNPCWVAEFNRYAITQNDYRHYEAIGNTAPLAICRAALIVSASENVEG